MRWRKRSPKRSMLSRMRGTSAMSTPEPTIMGICYLLIRLWQLSRPSFREDPQSEEIVATVDHLPIDHSRFSEEFVWVYRAFSIDMQNLVPMCHEPIRDDHAMAAEVH